MAVEFGEFKVENNAFRRSKDRVVAVIDPQNQIRRFGNIESAAYPDGAVKVKFGSEEMHEQWEDVPCPSLDDVPTPRTPSPSPDHSISPSPSPKFGYYPPQWNGEAFLRKP